MITTRWYSHLKTKNEQEEFIKELERNEELFKVLKDILSGELERCSKDRQSLKTYSSPNWSEYQADRNATERTLKEIIELLP